MGVVIAVVMVETEPNIEQERDRNYARLVPRWKVKGYKWQVLSTLFRLAVQHLRTWKEISFAFAEAKKRVRFLGKQWHWNKAFWVEGRCYWRLYAPAVASPALQQILTNEILSYKTGSPKGLIALFVAITNKCPLDCEHCLEGAVLNRPSSINLQDRIEIIQNCQQYGVGQIYLSGGEPLVIWKELGEILERVDTEKTDFWLATSGFRFSLEKAQYLKKKGLRGVLVSLDHHDAEKHNRFRGNKEAFDWAIQAIQNAQAVDLVTGVSLCATKEFVSRKNLQTYLALAKDLGVLFVQFLEPKPLGRFAGQDVQLSEDQLALLTEFYFNYNTQPQYRQFPIISYVEFLKKRDRCQGMGKMYLYVDSAGRVQPCPFCRIGGHSLLENDLGSIIGHLNAIGCG